MIDITEKAVTLRRAVVRGRVRMKPAALKAVRDKKVPKGDVLEAARIAGLSAAKKTAELIPYCHPLPLEHVSVEFAFGAKEIRVMAVAQAHAKTGVEMEAFAAVALACLTVYDMCKALDRGAVIADIKLVRKTGGKSGVYERQSE